MRVVFDFALDGPAWPGPLGHGDDAYGEAWVGPEGLIGLLETRLGLGAQHPSALNRACALVGRLRQVPGFWSRSFEVDPLGTSRRLIRDRDELALWGWSGQTFSPRLGALHEATRELPAGVPDRLRAIGGAIARRKAQLTHLITHTPIGAMPYMWRQVFDALARSGVTIEERQDTPAPALGDLGGARANGFRPVGDGRLCLLRRHGHLDVADEVAAALARCDRLDDVVVVAGDPILDHALARRGLPRLGARTSGPSSIQLLPLALATAFAHMEMGDLHALLAADPGPVPRTIARRLLAALRESPGRRTPGWTKALSEGLAPHATEVDRDDREQRAESAEGDVEVREVHRGYGVISCGSERAC